MVVEQQVGHAHRVVVGLGKLVISLACLVWPTVNVHLAVVVVHVVHVVLARVLSDCYLRILLKQGLKSILH